MPVLNSIYHFFIIGFTASFILFASVIFSDQIKPYEGAMIAAGIVAYSVSFYLDVKSTWRFGRRRVATMESSPVFRIMIKRYGFASAVLVQIATEAGLAFVIVPYFVGYSLDVMISSVSLFLFGVMHIVGFSSNRVLIKK